MIIPWSKLETEMLFDFQEEMTVHELATVVKTRNVNQIMNKLIRLGLYPELRTCRYCYKSFKPRRRSQIHCCEDCNQLSARWRQLLARAEE